MVVPICAVYVARRVCHIYAWGGSDTYDHMFNVSEIALWRALLLSELYQKKQLCSLLLNS